MQKTGAYSLKLSFEEKKKDKKEKRFKKNVLIATWSGSNNLSDKSESEDEKANICYMAKSGLKDEVNDPNSYSLNELQDTFDLLME